MMYKIKNKNYILYQLAFPNVFTIKFLLQTA